MCQRLHQGVNRPGGCESGRLLDPVRSGTGACIPARDVASNHQLVYQFAVMALLAVMTFLLAVSFLLKESTAKLEYPTPLHAQP
eukprot:scaffold154629_cov19-Tisochrysis_lutea.AAC.1